jgi:hypothetical protein
MPEEVENRGSDNYGTKIKVMRGMKGGYGWEITVSAPPSVALYGQKGSVEDLVAGADEALCKRYIGGDFNEEDDVAEMN